MKSFLSRMVAIAGLGVVASCGEPRSEESFLLDEPAVDVGQDILLVVHGGYNSCATQTVGEGELAYETFDGDEFPEGVEPTLVDQGYSPDRETDQGPATRRTPIEMDMWRLMMPIRDSLVRESHRVKWLTSCYAAGDNTHDGGRNIAVTTSDEPTKTYGTSRDTTWRIIRDMARGMDKIYVMGHSHGGWTAMKTVLDLNSQNVPVTGLTTIDAISVPLCNSTNLLGNGDCLRFPPDITGQERNTLAQVTDHWLNFYQRSTGVFGGNLNSEAAPEADNAVAQQLIGVVHTEIDNNGGVWAEIETRLDSSL